MNLLYSNNAIKEKDYLSLFWSALNKDWMEAEKYLPKITLSPNEQQRYYHHQLEQLLADQKNLDMNLIEQIKAQTIPQQLTAYHPLTKIGTDIPLLKLTLDQWIANNLPDKRSFQDLLDLLDFVSLRVRQETVQLDGGNQRSFSSARLIIQITRGLLSRIFQAEINQQLQSLFPSQESELFYFIGTTATGKVIHKAFTPHGFSDCGVEFNRLPRDADLSQYRCCQRCSFQDPVLAEQERHTHYYRQSVPVSYVPMFNDDYQLYLSDAQTIIDYYCQQESTWKHITGKVNRLAPFHNLNKVSFKLGNEQREITI